jgi:hypothetical protein
MTIIGGPISVLLVAAALVVAVVAIWISGNAPRTAPKTTTGDLESRAARAPRRSSKAAQVRQPGRPIS